MRTFVLTLVAGTIAGASSMACAADLPSKAPVLKAPAPASLSWTGFYLGLNGGYGSAKSTNVTEADIAPLVVNISAAQRQFSLDHSSFLGGAQAGFNWQFAHQFVASLEADVDYLATAPTRPRTSCSAALSPARSWRADGRTRLAL